MRKTFLKIGAVAALLAASCGPGSEEMGGPFEFAETIQLTCDSLPIGEILIPAEWEICGDKAVISSPRTDSLFYVYRLPDFEYLYAFGRKGEGPYDYRSATLMADVHHTGRLWTGDLGKAISYQLSDGGAEDAARQKTAGMRPDAILHDSITVSFTRRFSAQGMHFYCNTGHIDGKKGFSDTLTALLHTASVKVSVQSNGAFLDGKAYNMPKNAYLKDGFVWVYPDVRSIRFYTVSPQGRITQEKIIGSDLNLEQINALPESEMMAKSGFTIFGIQTTDRYLYVFTGEKNPESGAFESYAEVYDLSGRKVRRLAFGRYLSAFLADEARGKIYAHDRSKDFDQVYVYDMKL